MTGKINVVAGIGLANSGGTFSITSEGDGCFLAAGSNWKEGARLTMRSFYRQPANDTGAFALTANNGTTSYGLTGRPSGTLTWGSQEVARFASASLTGSPWYVKYNNGLIIQGQNFHITSYGLKTITLPISFQTTNYATPLTIWLDGATTVTGGADVSVISRTTTSFDVYVILGSYSPSTTGVWVSFVAIGY